MKDTCAVVLAAGKGTRMKSKKPKVLAEILFQPMLGYVLETCRQAEVEKVCVVTGFEAEQVEAYLSTWEHMPAETVLQAEQRGTGHAVMMAREFLQENIGTDVLVLYGDTPYLSAEVIEAAYLQHKRQNNAVTVVTALLQDPTGYGRIIRDGDAIAKIVEQRDATEKEQAVKEINSGVYWFNTAHLLEMLSLLQPNNAQGEYYLTDTIGLTIAAGKRVGGYCAENSDIILGANSRKDLYELNEKMRMSIIYRHMENGVTFASTDGVMISPDAQIGADTVILGGTIIKDHVVIGEDCVIGPNSLIQKSTVGDRVKLNAVQCYQSRIHSDVDIGPFVHIRPNSEIKSFVHIGDFVEVKNSTIGEGTGISHLTYVGDSDVGKNVNFGCGVVTVNYDGVHKHRCQIEDEAFIGCNTNLVAPVRVGKSAYTAAGSTITKDVPDYALAIARSRQEEKPGYAAKKLAGRKKKV
jgi:bifunctional UDP-N-acetylglucosamine pyrophosphorylase/glucosamine-1-phosphate N-acetyltransferase